MSAPGPCRDELPDDLADRAAELLLETAEPERAAILAALITAHPRHAADLQRLLAEQTPRRRLAAELRCDLDWITLKALARERGDRYANLKGWRQEWPRRVGYEAKLGKRWHYIA